MGNEINKKRTTPEKKEYLKRFFFILLYDSTKYNFIKYNELKLRE